MSVIEGLIPETSGFDPHGVGREPQRQCLINTYRTMEEGDPTTWLAANCAHVCLDYLLQVPAGEVCCMASKQVRECDHALSTSNACRALR